MMLIPIKYYFSRGDVGNDAADQLAKGVVIVFLLQRVVFVCGDAKVLDVL